MAPTASAPAYSPARTLLASSVVTFSVGGLAGLVVLGLGWPGWMLIWASIVVRGVAAYPPMLRGPKDPTGHATPADPSEVKALASYQQAVTARQASVNLAGLVPPWPFTADWLGAGWAGLIAATLPQAWGWSRLINGVAAAMSVAAWTATARTHAGSIPAPRATLTTWWDTVAGSPGRAIMSSLVGLVVGTAGGVILIAVTRLPLVARWREAAWDWLGQSWPIPVWVTVPQVTPGWWTVAGCGVAGILAGGWPGWKKTARRLWVFHLDCERSWSAVWQSQKISPPPTIVNVEEITVGTQVVGFVETFDSPARPVPGLMLILPGLLAGMNLPGHEMMVLECEAVDEATGQVVEGQVSTRVFRVVHWLRDRTPHIFETVAHPQVTRLLIESAVAVNTDIRVQTMPRVSQVTAVSTLDAPHPAWLVGMSDAGGDHYDQARRTLAPGMSAWLDTPVLIDTVVSPVRVLVGDFTMEDECYNTGLLPIPGSHREPGSDPGVPVPVARYASNLVKEDRWSMVWRSSLSATVLPPALAHPFSSTRRVDLGAGVSVDVDCATFAVPGAVSTVKDILAAEPKLATAVRPKTEMLTLTWLLDGQAARPGTRHGFGVRVLSCTQPVPSPDRLPPQGAGVRMGPGVDSGVAWLWTMWVNRAFDEAKLPRPEVVGHQCLTMPVSQEHVWQVNLRVYGDVTAKKIRDKLQVMQASLRTPWLSMAELPSGDALLLVGANPLPGDGEQARVEQDRWLVGQPVDGGPPLVSAGIPLPPHRRHRGVPRLVMSVAQHTRVEDIVCRTWFSDAGVTSNIGERPRMVSSRPVDTNPRVTQRVFTMPSGVTFQQVRAAVPALMSASGDSFVEARRVPGDAGQVCLLFAHEDPLPRLAGYDYGVESTVDSVPFGVVSDGSVLTVCMRDFAHLLLTGTTNSGKSGSAAALFFSFLRAGCDAVVIDYSRKGAKDFEFARPWVRGFATSEVEAQALLEALLTEMSSRIACYGAHGGVDILGIPAGERPPRIVVFLDEFSEATTIPAKPSQVADPSPDMERIRLAAQRTYTIRTRICYLLKELASTGRAAGIHLVFLGQVARTMDLPAPIQTIKNNMNMCLLGVASSGQRMSGLINPGEAPDPGQDIPYGRGVWDPRMGVPQVVQFWFDDTSAYREWLQANRRAAEPLDISGFMPREADLVGFTIDAGSRINTPGGPGATGGTSIASWEEAGVDWDAILATMPTPSRPVPTGPVAAPPSPPGVAAVSALVEAGEMDDDGEDGRASYHGEEDNPLSVDDTVASEPTVTASRKPPPVRRTPIVPTMADLLAGR